MRDRPLQAASTAAHLAGLVSESEAEEQLKFKHVDEIILETVKNLPGYSAEILSYNVFNRLVSASVPPLPEAPTVLLVRDRFHELALRGDLAELTVADTSGKRTAIIYYPGGTVFSHVPANIIFGQKEPPGMLIPVAPGRENALKGVEYIMATLESHERLRILRTFCDRCGAPKAGHWCNV